MTNVNKILYLFDNLIRQKYLSFSLTEPSTKNHELADQLFFILYQLLNAGDVEFENIKTLDFNTDDDNEEYQEENKDDTPCNIDDLKYSYNTIRYKRIKRHVKEQRTKFYKRQCVDEFVYTEFMRARRLYLPIHDSDVRRLAFKKAREINLNDLTASDYWILNFKRRYHISSRKITKLVTKHHLEDHNEILRSAKNFC